MSVQVTVTVTVAMTGLANQQEITTITTEAFDKISATIEAGATDQEVNLAPGVEADFKMILIRASAYDPTNPLTYKVHDVGEQAITLDMQHPYLGSQDKIAGAAVPFDKLFVSNPGASNVTLEVLVARDATP